MLPPTSGTEPRPLHWQADSYPLLHQGSPISNFLNIIVISGVKRKHSLVNKVCSENSIAKICKRLKQVWKLHNVGSKYRVFSCQGEHQQCTWGIL